MLPMIIPFEGSTILGDEVSATIISYKNVQSAGL